MLRELSLESRLVSREPPGCPVLPLSVRASVSSSSHSVKYAASRTQWSGLLFLGCWGFSCILLLSPLSLVKRLRSRPEGQCRAQGCLNTFSSLRPQGCLVTLAGPAGRGVRGHARCWLGEGGRGRGGCWAAAVLSRSLPRSSSLLSVWLW